MVLLTLRRLSTAVVSFAVPALVLSACGGASGDENSSASSGSAADSAALQHLFNGDTATPPAASPPAAKGKNVWWISCGQQTQSCASYAAAGQAAAQALGWTFHLADGNLNQANGYATAMRTALATHPDAIVEDAFSCSTVQPELQQAKQQGVPVIGVETTDCSDAGTGPSLFTVPMVYSQAYPDNKAWWKGWGEQLGKFIVADSGGKAKIVTALGKGDPQFDLLNSGFQEAIDKCSGCSVVAEAPWTVTDLAPNGPWVSSLRNTLIKNPDADYVAWPFDTNAVDSGGAKAVLQVGSKAKVVSGIGTAPALALLRSGQIYAEGVARDSDWISWAAMDELNRYFNHQPSAPEGLGFVSIDKNHNMPKNPEIAYQTTVDFRSLYKKAWGVG